MLEEVVMVALQGSWSRLRVFSYEPSRKDYVTLLYMHIGANIPYIGAKLAAEGTLEPGRSKGAEQAVEETIEPGRFNLPLWDSEAWQKKSRIAKSNRDKGNDKAARHTGGSIGYDEYRVRLKKVLCREPNFREIFLLTHLDKASKTKLLVRELNLNSVNEMFFCNDRSKEAYTSYLEEMFEKNGLDFTVDDPEVWSHVVEPNLKRTRRVYGIGSSDINYVVSGLASSSSGVTQYDTQQLSQKKIHDLEVQMEVERRSRQELEEEIRKERHERLELQQQMKEFMKKFMQHPS
ncbi:hypothetical protein R6Q59_036759 [Mikania micrantha]